jgi:hypothetical protein
LWERIPVDISSGINELHAQMFEHLALQKLYAEYTYILFERKLKLRPCLIEIVDSTAHWGRWDRMVRTIQLSRSLLWDHPWFYVLGILRHEMAHQLLDEMENPPLNPGRDHGDAFQWACQKLGVPAQFARATSNLQTATLDWRESKQDEVSEKMLDKVRKLLALASSTNEHEALQAMNRVREIYAKYNLEQKSQAAANSNFFHVVISKKSKRIEAYEKKIIGILVGHFFVQVLMGSQYDPGSGNNYRQIEIIGTRENVLMAEYVYHFLMQQSLALVGQAAHEKQLVASRVARKSYRLGILEGFEEKLRTLEKSRASHAQGSSDALVCQALVAFRSDRKLDDYIKMVYPRLVSRATNTQYIDGEAYVAGKSAGQRINLNRPVESTRATGGVKFLT